MEEKKKKSKRIRYPKKEEPKQELKEEQPKKFTLEVQDSIVTNLNKFGR